MDTLIIGIGNPLRGDDGIGPKVIEWLTQQDLPSDVVTVDGGTAGLDLVSALIGHPRVIIVDAANLGLAPGEWLRFTPNISQLKNNDLSLSLHAAGLSEALRLGAALDVLPHELVIYGVQPSQVDWRPALSGEMQAAVQVVGQAVLKEIGRVHHAAICPTPVKGNA